jgi:hypothetical protein
MCVLSLLFNDTCKLLNAYLNDKPCTWCMACYELSCILITGNIDIFWLWVISPVVLACPENHVCPVPGFKNELAGIVLLNRLHWAHPTFLNSLASAAFLVLTAGSVVCLCTADRKCNVVRVTQGGDVHDEFPFTPTLSLTFKNTVKGVYQFLKLQEYDSWINCEVTEKRRNVARKQRLLRLG